MSLSSHTSRDIGYLKHCFDVICNKILSKGDLRQILKHGFQVDPDSPMGMSIQGNKDDGLADSMDSRQMTRNLEASQEYIKWDSFYTITCCQKDTPGTLYVNA